MDEQAKKIGDETYGKWGDLHTRQDADRDLVNLVAYTLLDVDGHRIPHSVSITLNDPAVFAWKVETALGSAVEQVSVTSESKRFDTAYVERFIRAIFKAADARLTNKGLWPFDAFIDQQTCRRGRAAARCLFQAKGDELVCDILPYDMRFASYWYGPDGLAGWWYQVNKSHDQAAAEYPDVSLVGTGDVETTEVLTPKTIDIYAGGGIARENKNPFGYVPVVYQPVPLGSMLLDRDTLKYQSESIFFLIRDLIPELNRLVSIIQSLNMKALDHALQLKVPQAAIDSTMPVKPHDEVTQPGRVNVVPSEGGYALMPIGDLQQSAQLLHEMIQTRVSEAMSRFVLQDPSTPKTATEIIANLRDRDIIIAPRLVTRGLLKQRIAEMAIKQTLMADVAQVKVGNQTFDTAKLKGEYEVAFKYSFRDAQGDIARVSMATAERGLIPDRAIRRDTLQRENPDEDERQLLWEQAGRTSPLINMDRQIRALLEEADSGMPGAEGQAMMLAAQLFPALEQAMAGRITPEPSPEVKPGQPLVPLTAGGAPNVAG